MSFKFDLRPSQYKQITKKSKVDVIKYLFVFLFVVFLIAGSGSLGFQYFRWRELLIKEEALNQSIAALQSQSTKLSAELTRLKNEEQKFISLLTLVKEDLPSLEFVAAVEGSLPGTVWINKIDMGNGMARMEGKAYAEADVVIFSNALAQATVIKDVMVPNVKKVEERDIKDYGSQRTVDFTMQCALRDIAAMDSAEETAAKTE